MISTRDFILNIYSTLGIGTDKLIYKDIVNQGRIEGWLEESDELFPEFEIDRRGAARIVHLFLKTKCGIADISDWSKAKKCSDLYDCKVCANHVAQVIERDIISPKSGNRFDLLAKVSEEDMNIIGFRVKQLIHQGL